MSIQTPEPSEVGSADGLSGAAAPDAARRSRARRLLRRLSWLWVLLAGVGAYLLLLRTLLVTENPNFFPSLILLGSIVVPAAVLNRSRATFIAIGVFVSVVILHAVWDASSSSVVRIVVALLSFIALILTLVAARRAEGSVAAQTIQSTREGGQSTQAP
jgi:hypothetical protein